MRNLTLVSSASNDTALEVLFPVNSINSIDARKVWKFIESKQRFADWIKNRLEDFTEGVDFIVHKNMTQLNQVDTIDYILTLDTAKHICMLERNAKGKELRQYFINCEKKLQENSVILLKIVDIVQNLSLCFVDLSNRMLNLETNREVVTPIAAKQEVVYKRIKDFGKERGHFVPLPLAQEFGRKCVQRCKDLKLDVKTCNDSLYPNPVNIYPEQVLIEVFTEHFSKQA